MNNFFDNLDINTLCKETKVLTKTNTKFIILIISSVLQFAEISGIS